MGVVRDLFECFDKGEFPMNGGFIVSAFFQDQSMYSMFELISYNNVKDVHVTEKELNFQAEGKKIYWLVEPSNYPNKATDPTFRDDDQKIPYRMDEVEMITTKRSDRILIGKKPMHSHANFSVTRSSGQNYSYVFFKTDDIRQTMQNFFIKSLYEQAGVPRIDAKEASKILMKLFDEIMTLPA